MVVKGCELFCLLQLDFKYVICYFLGVATLFEESRIFWMIDPEDQLLLWENQLTCVAATVILWQKQQGDGKDNKCVQVWQRLSVRFQ